MSNELWIEVGKFVANQVCAAGVMLYVSHRMQGRRDLDKARYDHLAKIAGRRLAAFEETVAILQTLLLRATNFKFTVDRARAERDRRPAVMRGHSDGIAKAYFAFGEVWQERVADVLKNNMFATQGTFPALKRVQGCVSKFLEVVPGRIDVNDPPDLEGLFTDFMQGIGELQGAIIKEMETSPFDPAPAKSLWSRITRAA